METFDVVVALIAFKTGTFDDDAGSGSAFGPGVVVVVKTADEVVGRASVESAIFNADDSCASLIELLFNPILSASCGHFSSFFSKVAESGIFILA